MSRHLAAILSLLLVAAVYPHAQGRCGSSYAVVRGDTLYSIARHCRSSVAAIARASRLADPRRIEVGQMLTIPGARAAPAAKPEEAPPPPAAAQSYRIQPADTLYSLARWARVGLPALLAANPGINPGKIELGEAVRLPAGAVDPTAMRARERGGAAPAPRAARLRTYLPLPPPPREERAPREERPPRRDDKPDEVDDPRRGPEGM